MEALLPEGLSYCDVKYLPIVKHFAQKINLVDTINMARHGLGPGAFVYVADSAFVTPDNLQSADQSKIRFLTRLPATYKECSRAIDEAVAADNWIEIGTLNQTPAPAKRKAAYYRGFETTVELYGRPYRAVVVHSSAHDKRRHKRIDRLLAQK